MLFNSEGNLLEDYKEFIGTGAHLVVMPIARVNVEWTARTFPGMITFYPIYVPELPALNIIPNSKNSSSLAEICSEASGVNEDILKRHPLIVFPYRFDWHKFRSSNHDNHLQFIRQLSEYVDRACLNFIRYSQCPIEIIDCLPGRAGQLNSNHMMAGALLYNQNLRESRIIGGGAFTHFITVGAGLPLESMDQDVFPKSGEVGSIVDHALLLYTSLLEAANSTARFIQALSLLEFLAYPNEYHKFQEIKKVIARYNAKDQPEYKRLLKRFFELTGEKDSKTGRMLGYRTRIVHMGERIEDILPDDKDRKNLFMEVGGYIKSVINHMINHSEKSFDEYLLVRESLRPYED